MLRVLAVLCRPRGGQAGVPAIRNRGAG